MKKLFIHERKLFMRSQQSPMRGVYMYVHVFVEAMLVLPQRMVQCACIPTEHLIEIKVNLI